MRMLDLKKNFKQENKEWIRKHKDDKIMLNLAWSDYLDGLCKDGLITQKQWENHGNIF